MVLFCRIATLLSVIPAGQLDPLVPVSQTDRGDALAGVRAQWGHESQHLEPVSSPQPGRTAVTSDRRGRCDSVAQRKERCVICSI